MPPSRHPIHEARSDSLKNPSGMVEDLPMARVPAQKMHGDGLLLLIIICTARHTRGTARPVARVRAWVRVGLMGDIHVWV